ncbi:hypothetical protein K3495_g9312 [Podosphaera aphanis]|nr:hypothetical protein K3495_g9312 [Podosphaera aphanis]
MIMTGEFLCGIPWGAFQALTCAYVSDVCPVQLRSYMTTYSNLYWVIGQLLGSGVLRALVERPDEWSYCIPFAIQWFWPVPIAVALIFAPESPWCLVRYGRRDAARKAVHGLTDLNFAPKYFSIHGTLAMISVTNDMELSQSAGASYLDCFKGVNKRRTEISCATWAIQNFCGSALSYSTYFFVQAGLPTIQAFNMSLVQYSIGLVGTLFSWWFTSLFDRRTLFVSGL